MRRLIVNADDFGLTPGINRAILEAHKRGVVTSATLMANGPAFADAVELARTAPQLGIGCHVVLLDGTPLLGAKDVSSLLADRAVSEPRFRTRLNDFAWQAVRGKLDAGQIEAEATAQIRKIQSAGVTVSHFDTHKHTHMFLQILRPLLRAAKRCGVRAARNPFENIGFAELAEHPRLLKRWLSVRALRVFARSFRREVQAAGLSTTDGSIGVAATGYLSRNLLRAMIMRLPAGTQELVCHPGYNDAHLQGTNTRLLQSREEELELLTSADIRTLVERQKIELVSYQNL